MVGFLVFLMVLTFALDIAARDNKCQNRNTGHPLLDEPSILTNRRTAAATATEKQELTRFAFRQSQIFIDCLARVLGQFEPD